MINWIDLLFAPSDLYDITLSDAVLSEHEQALCQPQHKRDCSSATRKYICALDYCGECNRTE